MVSASEIEEPLRAGRGRGGRHHRRWRMSRCFARGVVGPLSSTDAAAVVSASGFSSSAPVAASAAPLFVTLDVFIATLAGHSKRLDKEKALG